MRVKKPPDESPRVQTLQLRPDTMEHVARMLSCVQMLTRSRIRWIYTFKLGVVRYAVTATPKGAVTVLNQILELLQKRQLEPQSPPTPLTSSYGTDHPWGGGQSGLTCVWGQRRKLLTSSFFLLGAPRGADLPGISPGSTLSYVPSGRDQTQPAVALHQSLLGAPVVAPAWTVPDTSSHWPHFTDEEAEAQRGM